MKPLERKIGEICEEVWADEPPLVFLTEDTFIHKALNRERRRNNEAEKPFKPNFRLGIAKKKEYKATRKAEKPFHFNNITSYLLSRAGTVVAEGMEADDLLSIYQNQKLHLHHSHLLRNLDKAKMLLQLGVQKMILKPPFWLAHLVCFD